MVYGQEYKIHVSEWQLLLWSGRGIEEKTAKANASYSATAKWNPFQESSLVITHKGKTYNLTELPLFVKMFVGGGEGDGMVILHPANQYENTGDHIEVIISTPVHLDSSTVKSLDTLTIQLDDVVVGKHVMKDGSEATTDKWLIPVSGYEMTEEYVADKPTVDTKVEALQKSLTYLTYAVVALGLIVLFKLFH